MTRNKNNINIKRSNNQMMRNKILKIKNFLLKKMFHISKKNVVEVLFL